MVNPPGRRAVVRCLAPEAVTSAALDEAFGKALCRPRARAAESGKPPRLWDTVAGLPVHTETDRELGEGPAVSPVCRRVFVVFNKCEGRSDKNSVQHFCRAVSVCQGLWL